MTEETLYLLGILDGGLAAMIALTLNLIADIIKQRKNKNGRDKLRNS